MFGNWVPREGRFYDLFEGSAEEIVKAAKAFREMLNDLPNSSSHARTITACEQKADEYTHRTVELLHKTFITPLDREDIHSLITRLDDIIDYIEAAAERVHLYEITSLPSEAKEMADICVKSVTLIKKIIGQLNGLKNPDDIVRDCVEINKLENDADYVLRGALAKLFREEKDLRNLIKFKEIFELLETVTDRCEDVANTVEGIVMEYS